MHQPLPTSVYYQLLASKPSHWKFETNLGKDHNVNRRGQKDVVVKSTIFMKGEETEMWLRGWEVEKG